MGIGIKRAIEKRSIRSAYTLAEVVIVMLVVAVIVGVSIKITKAKLDNIVSYTYYSGYSTLRNVTKQVLNDFKPTDGIYMDVSNRLNIFERLFSSAFANDCYLVEGDQGSQWCINYSLLPACDVVNWDCNAHIGEYGITQEMCDYGDVIPYQTWLMKGKYAGNSSTGLALVKKLVDEGKLPSDRQTMWLAPPNVIYYNSSGIHETSAVAHDYHLTDECNYGHYVLISSNVSIPDDPEPTGCTTVPSDDEKQAQYCQGKEFDQTTCSWKNITPWPPCDGEGMRWSQNSCACVQEQPTVPRKGINFCEKFVSYANTKSNSSECSGDAIPSDLTDFSGKTADITLRNGMRIYNIRQNPAPIQVLANNIQGASYDGVDNVNEYGYTVYLDIDGEKGPSTLWQDVYPFYITMSGTVIPAYNMTVNAEEAGGNSRHHLMTSIEKESIDATGHRKLYWVSKSVSYKDGACSAGYIGASTAYCNGVQLKTSCSGEDGICILKYVSPVKFFQ